MERSRGYGTDNLHKICEKETLKREDRLGCWRETLGLKTIKGLSIDYMFRRPRGCERSRLTSTRMTKIKETLQQYTASSPLRWRYHHHHRNCDEGFVIFIMSQMKGRIYLHYQSNEDAFAIRMIKLPFVGWRMKRFLLSYSLYFVTHVVTFAIEPGGGGQMNRCYLLYTKVTSRSKIPYRFRCWDVFADLPHR